MGLEDESFLLAPWGCREQLTALAHMGGVERGGTDQLSSRGPGTSVLPKADLSVFTDI